MWGPRCLFCLYEIILKDMFIHQMSCVNWALLTQSPLLIAVFTMSEKNVFLNTKIKEEGVEEYTAIWCLWGVLAVCCFSLATRPPPPQSSACSSVPADCCVLLYFLGCRTLTLRDIQQRLTAPTWAALPAPSRLTRLRASPWRALTTWVGTHELLQHSDLTPQQLIVPMTLRLFSLTSPPASLQNQTIGGEGLRGREYVCLLSHKQCHLTTPSPFIQ